MNANQFQRLIASGFFLLFFSCENDMTVVNKVTSGDPALLETTTNIQVLYSEMGHVHAKLNAPLMIEHNTTKPYTEFPKGILVLFYDNDLHQKGQLTAEKAIAYQQTGEVVVTNNVQVVNIKGEKLTTEELHWNNETQKITTDKFVQIQTPDQIIYGTGLEANQDLTNYTIKHISGIVHLHGGALPD